MAVFCTNSYDPTTQLLFRVLPVALTTIYNNPEPASGASFNRLEFVQSTAATVWTWNHNLGYKPVPIVTNLAGGKVLANIQVSTTQIIVTTNPAQVGRIII